MNPILNKLSKQFLSKKPANFRRFLYDKIDFKVKIIGITGGRGSGKTTLMHQCAKSTKYKASHMLYISCDHPAMAGEDLYMIADEFQAYGGKLLLIDEIHKIKDFAKHIKAMYDFTNLQVIFSGSSTMQILYDSADLSRRASIYKMPVLSFREFLVLSDIAVFEPVTLEDLVKNHEDISMEHIPFLKNQS